MYLIETKTGEAMIAAATTQSPFGPGLKREDLAGADKMDVFGSSFDEGSDFVEFVVVNSGGHVLAKRRVAGY